MLKRITATMLSAAISMTNFSYMAADNSSTTSEAYIPSETIVQTAIADQPHPIVERVIIEIPTELKGNFLSYTETDNLLSLKQLRDECELRKINASQMAEAARNCGYPEDHPIIQLAQEEWHNANNLAIIYTKKIDATNLSKAWKEYPVATEVWLYLTDTMGYSDYVAAGIMGNMMAECGGFTLNLDWTVTNTSSGCYGLCQWHPRYHQSVQEANLQAQLDYAYTSFPEVLSRYASSYQQGFSYNKFLAMTDVREIAKAFCLIYEKPGGYDPRRGEYAAQAYSYFVK
jgi:hypothetical protein